MKKFQRFILILPLLSALFLSSCYYDYGVDTENSDLVLTFYNKDYDFGTVTKYYYADSVKRLGTEVISFPYDQYVIDAVNQNLTALGWQKTDTLSRADIVVTSGVTTSTYVVTTGWYDYYGYYWYYPPYYYDTYTYTTGTIAVLMSDYRLASGGKAPVEWSGVLNGLGGQGNAGPRITTGLNQAFSQSPYLK
ncbi:MAG: DUF4136 domain-containing protein [Ignavibacteria bacterium]|nr:DUF4136 domain-containing protein [Ignavibacteria bacterium]